LTVRDRRSGHGTHGGPLAGWPSGDLDPLTPAGEQQQLGRMISGLARQRGWRLIAARVAAVVLLLLIAAVVLAGLIHVLA
jgi:hypothetical protein